MDWKKILQDTIRLALARPAIAVMFFVLGVAVVSQHVSGKPVLLGEAYNLNNPDSVRQLSYSYPNTAEAVKGEFIQDGSGRAVLFVSSIDDPK